MALCPKVESWLANRRGWIMEIPTLMQCFWGLWKKPFCTFLRRRWGRSRLWMRCGGIMFVICLTSWGKCIITRCSQPTFFFLKKHPKKLQKNNPFRGEASSPGGSQRSGHNPHRSLQRYQHSAHRWPFPQKSHPHSPAVSVPPAILSCCLVFSVSNSRSILCLSLFSNQAIVSSANSKPSRSHSTLPTASSFFKEVILLNSFSKIGLRTSSLVAGMPTSSGWNTGSIFSSSFALIVSFSSPVHSAMMKGM